MHKVVRKMCDKERRRECKIEKVLWEIREIDIESRRGERRRECKIEKVLWEIREIDIESRM